MKNINYKINGLKIVVLFLLIAAACSKDEVGQLSLARQFTPTKFTITNGETQSIVTWSASLFTTSGQVSYTVEISDKVDDFSNPAYTTTTTDVSVVLTDNDLAIKKDYYARVKAVGQDKTGDSYWAVSSSFRILGEQFLNPVTTTNVIDTAVRLTWRPSNELTNIVVTPTAGGTPVSVNLSAANLTAALKQVGKLAQNTAYTAEIFAGTKTKGTTQFTTKTSIAGNIINLSSTTGNPGILVTTLNTAPSGSVIVLRRGEPYDIATAYSLSKSVTIMSALDFGTNYATLRMGSNFNLAAGTIDSLVFKDLTVKGTQAALTANAGYLINANVAGAIVTKLRIDNCSLKILRGVVRGQAGTAGVKYTNYIVNNCMIDSIRDFAVAAASGTSMFVNIKITNTTVYRARKFIIHAVTGNTSVSIENCTFNELPSGAAVAPPANFFIDFSTFTTTTSLSIKNSIFGAAWMETSAGGTVIGGIRAPTGAINVTNSYSTSDFFANAGNTNAISGLAGYSGSSTALFKNTDPAAGSVNFGFKDSNFIGKGSAGDPRWR
ncbi:MAG TPA: DUF4957 domain-containing protein [Cyclobacteriaceae bacterium]|nr:DUF4957 domain-containing protein [Cyclobacteriaceae bacterium]